MVLDLKILMYRRADEIEKPRKIKADSDKQLLQMLQQVKGLSDSNTALRQELDELKVAAQVVVDMVDIAEEDAEAPLTLVEKVQRVSQGVMKYISATTRQYVSHVLGLVKSYWPHSILAPLGEGMNPNYEDSQLKEYLREGSPVADRIVSSLEQWALILNFL